MLRSKPLEKKVRGRHNRVIIVGQSSYCFLDITQRYRTQHMDDHNACRSVNLKFRFKTGNRFRKFLERSQWRDNPRVQIIDDHSWKIDN